jgi:hypothetical protein
MDTQTTNRGTVYSISIGALVVTYTTGKDADAATPVFDLGAGDVSLENTGEQPLDVTYNTTETFLTGHHFTFGTGAQEELAHSHFPQDASADLMRFTLQPGQKTRISRMDYMELVERRGLAKMGDGVMSTGFEASLLVDGEVHILRFQPHTFRVALDRDWAQEEERYLAFYRARDGR